jgi:hypothetical protein
MPTHAPWGRHFDDAVSADRTRPATHVGTCP